MIPKITHRYCARAGVGLLVAAALVLSGCSGPNAGQEPPAPSTNSTSTTTVTTPGIEETATTDPSEKVSLPGTDTSSGGENTAVPDPSTTEGPPPANTPVPPPTPGSIHETVESRPAETKPPVDIKTTTNFGQEVVVEITEIKKIEVPSAGMPNEVQGPALAVTVKLINGTSKAVSLDSVVVEVIDSAEAPGGRMTGDPYDPLSGSLAAGTSASGTYVYTVAKDKRDPISIAVTLAAAEPVVLFRGAVR